MILKQGDLIQHGTQRYQIEGKIGSESSFGAVFKALDGDARPVVIKQLLGQTAIGRETGMDYAYTRQTFEREARILLAHNHPQIVRALDFFEREESLLLVLEFINGEDLDQALIKRIDETGAPFEEGEAIAIGTSLARVIHAIHQLPGQVLYRDLKPRNIMWDTPSRSIKIIDFGTARFMDQNQNATQALGTPGYAPPEFYSTSETLTFAADVYTIGATLYELVTGEMPEPLLTPNHFHGQETQLSEGFRAVITRSMDQNPRHRYQTAAEMERALAALGEPEQAPVISGTPRNPFPYLSCLCPNCGAQPLDNTSIFCSECGNAIHVMFLRIHPNGQEPGMDLFLDKVENLIGRTDMDAQIFPDVDLSRYDPDCFVSRRHCILRREGTRYLLQPLKTTNHTAINGHPLVSNRTVPINPGTTIELANLKVEFVVQPCMA